MRKLSRKPSDKSSEPQSELVFVIAVSCNWFICIYNKIFFFFKRSCPSLFDETQMFNDDSSIELKVRITLVVLGTILIVIYRASSSSTSGTSQGSWTVLVVRSVDCGGQYRSVFHHRVHLLVQKIS